MFVGSVMAAKDGGNSGTDGDEYECQFCGETYKNENMRDGHETACDQKGQDQSQNDAPEPEGDEGGNWVNQEEYDENTRDTEVVDLPDSPGQQVMVSVIPPMKFATIAENHDISQYTENLEQVDQNAGMNDNLDEALSTVSFYRDVIVPNILRPLNAHWDNPPEDPNAQEVFDLSTLTTDDLMAIIAAVIQEDPDELAQDARKNARAANR